MRRNPISIMARLIGLVKPLIHIMLLTILMGIAGYLCAIFITILGGYGILSVLDIIKFDLGLLFIIILILGLMRGILHYIEQASGHYIAFKLLAIIRDKVFKAIRKLSPAKLEGRDKGNLIAVITGDIELLEVFYAHTIAPIAIAIITSLIMVIFIGHFHPLLGLIAAIAYLCVGFVIPAAASHLGSEKGRSYRRLFGALNTYFLDSLRGLKECIQYHSGPSRLTEITRQSDELDIQQKALKSQEGLSAAVTNTAILFFDLAMLFTSILLMRQGLLGFEGVLIPVIALFSSFGPTAALSSLSNNLLQTFAAGERVLDILDESPVVRVVENGADITFDGGACKDLSFSYDAETILDKITMDFPDSKVIGIHGKSGSGKSTLLKLLMRFWDRQSGSLQLSGHDIREVNTHSLRENESYVTQSTYLFNDTIGANIRIARLNASDKEVAEAAKKASIHDFISQLPKGYDTPVGELGESLSGGERQRIGLARAFLHQAPFILLDEPTSNLDSLNEGIILKSIREHAADHTVVLVSHRRSTMGITDLDYSIENGRLS
ncbi:ABC transporter ATP-binding protein [Eubacterium sp. 1001713B170207_170306_E7]|uniref:amino acid ABC transporter ATP-binding/permease protein n=1 Tax=Eubacterium sp. 1001713B170207_170306_E7 TaxID=2787097 RepID=UPI00189BB823|nr:ABC transporter ATP-binding protein [Eubacterium sp. 1001713B170207_170306_E7]